LSSEQLAQLFQPFNRLSQTASAEEGAGIGLVFGEIIGKVFFLARYQFTSQIIMCG
jgi:K+-sensing histidine kinase KdpD